jgi:hypothetical protein
VRVLNELVSEGSERVAEGATELRRPAPVVDRGTVGAECWIGWAEGNIYAWQAGEHGGSAGGKDVLATFSGPHFHAHFLGKA